MSPDPWNDIRARILAANLGVPIEWQNEPFQEPHGGLWLSVEGTANLSQPLDIGADVWVEEGTAYIYVNAPINTGSSPARALAKQIANLFRNIGPQPTIYLGGAIGGAAVSLPNGRWWSLLVKVDYRYTDKT